MSVNTTPSSSLTTATFLGHAWAAIQDPDGTWYHYDPCKADSGDSFESGYHIASDVKYAIEKVSETEVDWFY